MVASEPTTFYVDADVGLDTNPGTQALPFKSLTKAVDVAVDGDTIVLAAGTYSSDETFPIVINEDFTIIGNGAVLDSSSDALDGNTIEAYDCSLSISDMTVIGASGIANCSINLYVGFGIIAFDCDLFLDNVECNNNSMHGLYWLYRADGASGVLDLADFSASGNGYNGLVARTYNDCDIEVSIDGADISGNNNNGIYIDTYWNIFYGAADITIDDVVCEYNGGSGMKIDQGKGEEHTLSISNSRFDNNSRMGINWYEYGFDTSNASLENVSCCSNEYHGIKLDVESVVGLTVAMENVDCSSNGGHGYRQSNYYTDDISLSVTNSTFEHNSGKNMIIYGYYCGNIDNTLDTITARDGTTGIDITYWHTSDVLLDINNVVCTGNTRNGSYLGVTYVENFDISIGASLYNSNVNNGLSLFIEDALNEGDVSIIGSQFNENSNNGMLYVLEDATAGLTLEDNEFVGNGADIAAPLDAAVQQEKPEGQCKNPSSIKLCDLKDCDMNSDESLDGDSITNPLVRNSGAFITSIEEAVLRILFSGNVFEGNSGPGCAFNTGFENSNGNSTIPGQIIDMGLYYSTNSFCANDECNTLVDEGEGICTLNGNITSIVSMQPVAMTYLGKANALYCIVQGSLPCEPTTEMEALLAQINDCISTASLTPNYIFATGQLYQALDYIAQLQAMME